MIAEHLDDLTSAVMEYCESPAPLKDLFKMYAKLTKMAREPEMLFVKEKLVQCVPKLVLSENQGMRRMLDSVVAAAREEGSDGTLVTMEDSLYRTIARKVVLFLMQYGTILEDKSEQEWLALTLLFLQVCIQSILCFQGALLILKPF